jgi:hypothetical protein
MYSNGVLHYWFLFCRYTLLLRDTIVLLSGPADLQVWSNSNIYVSVLKSGRKMEWKHSSVAGIWLAEDNVMRNASHFQAITSQSLACIAELLKHCSQNRKVSRPPNDMGSRFIVPTLVCEKVWRFTFGRVVVFSHELNWVWQKAINSVPVTFAVDWIIFCLINFLIDPFTNTISYTVDIILNIWVNIGLS